MKQQYDYGAFWASSSLNFSVSSFPSPMALVSTCSFLYMTRSVSKQEAAFITSPTPTGTSLFSLSKKITFGKKDFKTLRQSLIDKSYLFFQFLVSQRPNLFPADNNVFFLQGESLLLLQQVQQILLTGGRVHCGAGDVHLPKKGVQVPAVDILLTMSKTICHEIVWTRSQMTAHIKVLTYLQILTISKQIDLTLKLFFSQGFSPGQALARCCVECSSSDIRRWAWGSV